MYLKRISNEKLSEITGLILLVVVDRRLISIVQTELILHQPVRGLPRNRHQDQLSSPKPMEGG